MPSAVVAGVDAVAIPGLTITEFHGNLATKDGKLSAVHEKVTAPAMSNPWRCPEFAEYILVIKGEAQVEYSGGKVVVQAGEGVYLPAGLLVRVNMPGPAELAAICLPAFSPAIEHATHADAMPSAPAHATDSKPTLVKSVDVVKAPDLTITEYFGGVSSKEAGLSACVAEVRAPCSEAWQKPTFAEWVLVLTGTLHLETADGITKVPAGSGVFLAADERVKWVWPEPCTYVPICMPAFTPDGCRREEEAGSAKDIDPATMAGLHELHAQAKAS
jgi:mannose-6-phosphate isomerase-like protein (cupin superfamily)